MILNKIFKFILIFLTLLFVFSQFNQVSISRYSIIQLDGASSSCKSSFFGLEPWFEFLKTYPEAGNNCNVCFVLDTHANSNNGYCANQPNSIPLVVMAIIDDLLRLAGLVAVAYIIYAGFQYVTSQGNPEKAAKAQQSILYALVGLVIAVSAVVLVTYIGNTLAK